MIDGRPLYVAMIGETDAIVENDAKVMDTPDMGPPGTQFRVTLRVVGKWRYLDWEKLDKDSYDVFSGETLASIRGTYYVSMDDGSLTEMQEDPDRPGVYTARVVNAGPFQILRNADWGQAFYPPAASSMSGGIAEGPDEQGYGCSWLLGDSPGQHYEV